MMDTGSAIRQKVRLQQAADSAALTQAEWSARSLNVISMNNVAQTQLYTTQITGAAMQTYLANAGIKYAETQVLVGIELARAASQPWPTNLVWLGIVGAYQTWFLVKSAPILDLQLKYKPNKLFKYSNRAMKATIEVNKYLTDTDVSEKTIQKRNGAVALELTRLQGGSNIYTHNGAACDSENCEGEANALGIPSPAVMTAGEATTLEALNIQLQFCNARNKGSPNTSSRTGFAGTSDNDARGFKKGVGPWMSKDGDEKAYEFVNDETKIGKKLSSFENFLRDVRMPRVYRSWKKPVDIIPSRKFWVGTNNDRHERDDNPFTELSEKFDSFYCGVGGAIDAATGGALQSLLSFAITLPEPAGLIGTENIINSTGASVLGGAAKLFAQESESLNVFVIVHSPGKRRHKNQSGQKIATYTYAQAQIYNPTAIDLYTQDWRARLVPASLLNGTGCDSESLPTPTEVLSKLNGSSGVDFDQFSDAFNGFNCEDWKNAIVY